MRRGVPSLTLATVLLAGALACAADPPPSPQARYDEARQTMQRGLYADAERIFRSIADADDAAADLRAQALFSVALMQQNQRHYETALQTFAEVQRRFPDSPLARRAADAVTTLTPGGDDQGLAFKRRFDEAMDAYAPARDALDRDDFSAARPGFERALTLLAAIERDFPQHPRAKDVAFLSGETHTALARFVEARADFERALAIAAAPEGDTFVTLARERIEESMRSRHRQVTTRAAWSVLTAIGIALLLVRPWTGIDGALVRLAARVAFGIVVLAATSVIAAWFIREYVDDHSPVTNAIAVMLVALPSLTGLIVTLGFVAGLRTSAGRTSAWPARTGAVMGALAAFAVAVCVVNAYELFPFLDSML